MEDVASLHKDTASSQKNYFEIPLWEDPPQENH